MNNKILITGADGFIGSHLVERLVKLGFNVKAFIYYNSHNSWGCLEDVDKNIKKEIEVISGDIRDYECIKESIKNCNYVFNLASLILSFFLGFTDLSLKLLNGLKNSV